MNKMKWLIRRELWEHKGMLFWAPLVVAGLMLLSVAAASLLAPHNVVLSNQFGDSTSLGELVDQLQFGENRISVTEMVAGSYIASTAPVFMMLGFLVFFYCLGALHDERRDRSLLFWKSLPLSDELTVLSKAVIALVVAPLIIATVASIAALLILLMAYAVLALNGSRGLAQLLATPEFYLTPLRVLALLPVYILWALPTVGWLLMISAWARSKVFLWALGIPLVAGGLLAWTSARFELGWDAARLFHQVIGRLLLGVAPGSWFWFDGERAMKVIEVEQHRVLMKGLFEQSWATLDQPGAWIGALAGALMIYAAIWLRRRRDDS